MGRNLPLFAPTTTTSTSPSSSSTITLPLPLIPACLLVATIAILSLCVSRYRRPFRSSAPPHASPVTKLYNNNNNTSPAANSPANCHVASPEALQRPPGSDPFLNATATATHGPIPPSVHLPAASHKRKLSSSLSLRMPDKLASSLSLKMPEKMSRVKTTARKDKVVEDSIWMKTIILGEKNKMPNEEDEMDGHVVHCDEHGNRQLSYRPRSSSISVPISRSNSFISAGNSFGHGSEWRQGNGGEST